MMKRLRVNASRKMQATRAEKTVTMNQLWNGGRGRERGRERGEEGEEGDYSDTRITIYVC